MLRIRRAFPALALSLVCAAAAAASTTTVPIDAKRPRLAVSPPRTVVTVSPASQTTIPVRVTNYAPKPVRLTADIVPLTASFDTSAFAEIDRRAITATDDTTWISLPKETPTQLEPGARVELPIPIVIPANAPPGVHPIGIRFTRTLVATTSSTQQAASVRLEGQVIAQVIIIVRGKTREGVGISNKQSPRVLLPWQSTAKLQATITNTGTSFVQAQPAVIMSAFAGRAEQTLEADGFDLLPDGKRSVAVRWNQRPLLGVFTPKLTISDGDTTYRTMYPRIIVLPPWWLILLFVAAAWIPVRAVRKRRAR